MKFKLPILYLLIAFLVMSCKTSLQENTTYFVGQIINPKEKEIHIYKDHNKIYTSKLNRNNEFSIKLDSLQEGLYTFKHGEEFQYIYLIPNDSIVMRLNTWDFDESLIFNGIGSKKNNFLLQLFLENEKDKKLLYKYSKLEETDFLRKTDSLINLKVIRYNKFKSKTSTSNGFDALINIAINYPIYSIKEKYAENYRLFNQLEKTKVLSKSFYAYRKNTDINNIQFLDYYAFKNFIGNYLLNLANEIKTKDNSKPLSTIILKQINSKIKNKKLRNSMLHNALINCLLDNKCCNKDKTEAKTLFFNNCSDKTKINDVENIVKSLDYLKKGTRIPNLKTTNFYGKQSSLHHLKSTKNTVLYFWPKEINRTQHMANRIHYLAKKYKNFTFIGIDNQLDNHTWKKLVNGVKLPKENQFQLVDTTKNKWFTNDIPRTIILNKKGIIQNDFTYLSHPDFEHLLHKAEKNL